MNEERTGLWTQPTEHIPDHLWHRYYLTVNQVRVQFFPGHCFCVSAVDGTVDTSTKVLGSADCTQKKRQMKMTKCQQIRQLRMISFAIWRGQWIPKCDALGNFQAEQCDNIGIYLNVFKSLQNIQYFPVVVYEIDEIRLGVPHKG